MASLLRCKGDFGLRGRLSHFAQPSLIIVRSGSGDAPSSSGQDLSCSGGPVGFGTLRKGFKPQPKKTQQVLTTTQLLNGRDKADVLRQTNVEIASKMDEEEDMWADWKRVDAKVNKYPCERLFTAVGSGGDEFREAMVKCVEDVVGGTAPVTVRPSSAGTYLSVRVGPVVMQDRDQVLAVFIKMREDKRLKFHL